MESHLAINLPALPLTSLHIESPVNITICNNTFIKFRDGAVEFVGLITNLNAPGRIMVVRKFLTWEQLKQIVPQARVEDVSFWPHSNKPPFFLCDTDLVADIRVEDILSIAFVFYEGDNMLQELHGIKDTDCILSCFYSRSLTIKHHCSFSIELSCSTILNIF